jgi:adenylate cyclase
MQEADEPASPSPDEVRAQLERIIDSVEFAVSERARSFLRYVVGEALDGRGERIKAYSIAVEVLGRDEGFDANADPAVRLEAGRLRRALERYYLVAGQADPVLIEIPKGAYVPVFATRAPLVKDVAPEPDGPADTPAPPRRRAWAAAVAPVLLAAIAFLLGASGLALLRPATHPSPGEVATSAAPGRPAAGPVLVVTPFADLGEGPEAGLYAAGLSEEVLAQLATSRELTVLGRETSRSIRPGSEATRLRDLGAGYALEGGVRVAGGRVRATSRLVDVATGAVLWSEAYDADAEPRSLLAGQEDIARRIATEVAQPFGAVTRAEAGRPPDDPAAYACTLRFHDYQAELGPALHAEVRGCLERAVAAYPRYATAWAMLSVIYLDEDRYRFNPEAGAAPVERAFEAAQRATALDPGNARALQAMMMALFFRQQVAEALQVGEHAVALNPNDTELLAEYGWRLGMSGEWARGGALIEQALARNPARAGYYHTTLALVAYMRRDTPQALAEIRQADLDKLSFFHGIAAVIYAEAGMQAEAAAAGKRFLELNPRFVADPEGELTKRNYRPEDRARIIEGLRKAGLPIQPPPRSVGERALGAAGRRRTFPGRTVRYRRICHRRRRDA